jgi:hypothetical protein
MDSDPGDVVFPVLDFAGVQSRANLNSQRSQRVRECTRAANRAPRTVEGCQDPVAGGDGGPDDTSPVLFDDGSGHDIMAVEKIAPRLVANRGELLGGSHHVGKQDRGERAVGLGRTVQPAQELLDVPQARCGRFGVQGDVTPRQHGKLCRKSVQRGIGCRPAAT